MFEESGRCRRGYFVEGLGAAQFGTAGAIDRLRTFSEVDPGAKPEAGLPGRHRPGQPLRRRAPLAATASGGPPPRSQGRRPGGPGRRRADPLRRARRPTLLTWSRRRRPAHPGGRVPGRGGPARARWAGSPSSGPTAPSCSARGSTPLREALHAAGLRGHAAGAEAEDGSACLRATPSTAPPGSWTARSAATCWSTSDLRVPQHATADLTGGTVVETVSRGKHLLTRVDRDDRAVDAAHPPQDGGRLAGARARPALAPPGAHRPGRARDRRRGRGRLLARHRRARSTGPTRTAPSATSAPTCSAPTGTRRGASRAWPRDPDRPLREALLDQRNLAGIGNMYAAELCFTSGVAPGDPGGGGARPAPAGARGRARCSMLNKERAVQSTTGDLRERERMWVFRRDQSPCRRCGTPDRGRRHAGAGGTRARVVLVPVLPAAAQLTCDLALDHRSWAWPTPSCRASSRRRPCLPLSIRTRILSFEPLSSATIPGVAGLALVGAGHRQVSFLPLMLAPVTSLPVNSTLPFLNLNDALPHGGAGPRR